MLALTQLIGIISYLVADLFASVYHVACYAVLQCYYVDNEIHEKSGKPAKNVPQHLKEFFETGEQHV